MTYRELYESAAAGTKFTAEIAKALAPDGDGIFRSLVSSGWADVLEQVASECEFRAGMAKDQERSGRRVILPRWPRAAIEYSPGVP